MNPDALTGLATRIPPPSKPTAAIFLDINHLGRINYDYDFQTGDAALARLGKWLAQQAAQLGADAFRVAGDEFILLLPGRTLEEADAIAKNLVAAPHELITLKAAVFTAGPDLPTRLKAILEELAEKLYRGG